MKNIFMSTPEESIVSDASENNKEQPIFNPFHDESGVFGVVSRTSRARRKPRSAMRSMFADIGDPLDLPCRTIGGSKEEDKSNQTETKTD
jgi:hypothetical protein